jgi:antagonist of KipI
MPAVRVIRPGLQTTVQDGGRWGWQARGVSPAGAVDPSAYRVSNALVGNAPGSAVLELTLAGPELEFEDARLVAVTGARFAMTVGGRPVPSNAGFPVTAGDRLQFGQRLSGARAYLAVSGGIAVPRVLGSRSTHLVSRLGGLDGRALAAGDRVPLGDAGRARQRVGSVPADVEALGTATPSSVGIARLRVLLDRHLERFETSALAALQSAPYTVGPESDRMGFRLEGPLLRHSAGADIVSDVTPLGTLQVPASGQPILLMADRPTTGGYACIATVITADIPVAAQLAPGDSLMFQQSTLGEALAAHVAAERVLMSIEDMVRP